jgi:hypothetical protein
MLHWRGKPGHGQAQKFNVLHFICETAEIFLEISMQGTISALTMGTRIGRHAPPARDPLCLTLEPLSVSPLLPALLLRR